MMGVVLVTTVNTTYYIQNSTDEQKITISTCSRMMKAKVPRVVLVVINDDDDGSGNGDDNES